MWAGVGILIDEDGDGRELVLARLGCGISLGLGGRMAVGAVSLPTEPRAGRGAHGGGNGGGVGLKLGLKLGN